MKDSFFWSTLRHGKRRGLSRSDFLEISRDEFSESFECFLLTLTFGGDGDHRAMTCSEHHEAQNTFSIDLIVVLLHADVARKGVRDLYELRCWASVNSELVCDGEVFLRHKKWCCDGEILRGYVNFEKRNMLAHCVNDSSPGVLLQNIALSRAWLCPVLGLPFLLVVASGLAIREACGLLPWKRKVISD